MVWAVFWEATGVAVGFWVFYSLLALIFKHKVSLIVTSLGLFLSWYCSCYVKGVFDYTFLAGELLAIFLILFLPQLQVRSVRKEEWRKAELKKIRLKQRVKLEKEKQLAQSLKKLDSVDELNETLNDDVQKQNLKLEKEKAFQKNLRDYCSKVNLCEIFMLVGICCFVFFSILMPMVLNSYNSDISLNYEKIHLNSLDKYNKTYLEEDQNSYHKNYFIYQRVNGEIKCYQVITRSNSSYEIYASKDELVEYFYDIEIASPPASFLSPVLFWCFIFLIVICFAGFITSIVFFKLNERKVINLINKNKFTNLVLPKRLINLEQKYERGVVAESDYRQQRRCLLFKIINNKIKFIL